MKGRCTISFIGGVRNGMPLISRVFHGRRRTDVDAARALPDSEVSRLLADRRREIGTRRGTRALTCFRQAVFALAWFRDQPDIRRLGQGSGISLVVVPQVFLSSRAHPH